MNRSEYAKHAGVQPQAVTAWLRCGTIQLEPDGSIDPAKADAARHDAQQRHNVGGAKSTYRNRFDKARTLREEREAALALVKLRQLRKELLPTEDFIRIAFGAVRTMRNRILGLPDRLAAELAAETDPTRVRILLARELAAVLDSCSDEIRREAEVYDDTGK